MRQPLKVPLTDIKASDRDWFFNTARIMALKTVGRSRPDLLDDAESEALLTGWLAYRNGCTRPTTAWAMRNGAIGLYRSEVGRTEVVDPKTGKSTYVLGHRNAVNSPCGLMFINSNGQEEEHRDLPRNLGGIDALLGQSNFENLLSMLPPRYALVLRLRYEDGMECEEIGPYIGSSTDRAQQIAHIALKRLRISAVPLLADHFDGMPPHDAALLNRAHNPTWVRKQQKRNKGPDKRYRQNKAAPMELYTHAGRSLSLVEWALQPESVVDYQTLRRRIVRGKIDFVTALTTPIKTVRPKKNAAREKREKGTRCLSPIRPSDL